MPRIRQIRRVNGEKRRNGQLSLRTPQKGSLKTLAALGEKTGEKEGKPRDFAALKLEEIGA